MSKKTEEEPNLVGIGITAIIFLFVFVIGWAILGGFDNQSSKGEGIVCDGPLSASKENLDLCRDQNICGKGIGCHKVEMELRVGKRFCDIYPPNSIFGCR